MNTVVSEGRQRRPYIYELDWLRALTALGVVAVHSLSFTAGFNGSLVGVQVQNAIVVALHFTREMFMFVTAFSLIYVYANRNKFSPFQFWKKRGIGVFLPYCIWSGIYIIINNHPGSLTQFSNLFSLDILTGNASFQLYYILLTLQFYLLFPLFLIFMQRVAHSPWIALALSFVLQVVGFYLDYHILQRQAFTGFWSFFSLYQSRIAIVYQFYFVLGGMTAWYWPQIHTFLLQHVRLISGVFIVALSALWMHFFIQIRIFQESIGYASSVLQPVMVLYSPIIIAFLFCMACLWARSVNAQGVPKGYRFWHLLSNTSFGIYLIHALLLTYIFRWMVPALPVTWPAVIRVFLVWFAAAGGSVVISAILLRIPVLSHLVGRGTTRKKRNVEQAVAMSTPVEGAEKRTEVA
jgi:Uncharacterized protein conserved in bacteria